MATREQSWQGKPIYAMALRFVAFVLPLLASLLVAIWLSRVIPRPSSVPGVIGWWLLIVVCATLALRLMDRFAKRLLPLAVLMKLTLVFPDKAPKRFGVALRSGSTDTLEQIMQRAQSRGANDDLATAAQNILALGAALNAHDPRTRGHGERVRAYVDMLGEELHLSPEQRNKLKWAAMLHDIGKLKVPTEIINKPGRLTEQEWGVMRNHPEWGMELAGPLLPWLGEWAGAIGQHHERYDGKGYPSGVAGEEISLAARITSVADSYDVMTSVRSYKEARPSSEARRELSRCSGDQFDPAVVRAFLNIAIGKQRWVAGPLSWLAQIPMFQSAFQAATSAATHAAAAVQAATAVGAIAVTTAVAPALMEQPSLALPPTGGLVVAADSLAMQEDGGEQRVTVLANDEGELDRASVTIVSGPSHGRAFVNSDGSLTYLPDPDFFGVDSISYRLCDTAGNCQESTVAIEVGAVNDLPAFGDTSLAVGEDGSLAIDVAALARDPDGTIDLASARVLGVPVNGLVLRGSGGTLTYLPPPNFSGIDSFTLELCDDAGACTTATVSVSVTPVNDPPSLEVSPLASVGGDPTTLVVAASDLDADPLTFSIMVQPSHGTASVAADGTVTYTSDLPYAGPDSFTIQVCDPSGACASAVVGVTATAGNLPPSVPALELAATEDTSATLDVLAAASDPDGDPLSLRADAITQMGGAVTVSGGTVTYQPSANFFGSDSFGYRVDDGRGGTVFGTITISVAAVNDPPVSHSDSYAGVVEGGTLFIAAAGVISNDTDIEGDALTATVVSSPAHGTLTLDPGGGFAYVHDGSENFNDSFTYQVSDGVNLSGVTTVSLSISPVNDNAPVGLGDAYSTTQGGTIDTAASAFPAVLANDTDADLPADTLITSMIGGPAFGTLTFNPDGSFVYVHDDSENFTDSFTYQVSDGLYATGPVSVSIAITPVNNNPPVANPDSYLGVLEGGILPIGAPGGVLANDTDADLPPDTLSATVVADPTYGTLTLNGDGSFTYTHDGSENFTDSFTYQTSDGVNLSNVTTVSLTITPVNDIAPVANPDAFSGLAEGGTFPIGAPGGVLSNDTDADLPPNTLTASVVAGPTWGTLTLNGDGSFTYTHDGTETFSDSFTYRTSDGVNLSNVATVSLTITPVNDNAPVANPDAYSGVAEGGTLSIAASSVLANDTDPDLPPNTLTAAVVTSPSHGILTLNGDGSFTYTHDGSENFTDSFTYQTSDGVNLSNVTTVSLTITPVNDNAPVAVADSYPLVVAEGGTVIIPPAGVLANDTDADLPPDTLTAAVVATPSHGILTLNGDGSFTYTHNGSENFTDSFTYQTSDGVNLSNPTTVSLTITPVNDPPRVVIAEFSTTGSTDFVEIYNAGSDPVDLEDWRLKIKKSGSEDVDISSTTILQPGQHFLFTRWDSPLAGIADWTFTSHLDDTVSFRLSDDSGTEIDQVATDPGGDFETSPLPAQPGFASSYERHEGGLGGNCVDTDDNSADFFANLDAPVIHNLSSPLVACGPATVPGTLRISEWQVRTASSPDDQYIEVHNFGTAPVDLTGYQIDVVFDATQAQPLIDLATVASLLAPGQHLLIAHTGYLGPVIPDATYNTVLGDLDGVRLRLGNRVADAVGVQPFFSEGQPLPALANQVWRRLGNECTDTNDNLADFEDVVATPDPDNLATPPDPAC